jgi:hypothetical protein
MPAGCLKLLLQPSVAFSAVRGCFYCLNMQRRPLSCAAAGTGHHRSPCEGRELPYRLRDRCLMCAGTCTHEREQASVHLLWAASAAA